jgi:ATP-dependent Clp protease protease subunit
LDDELANQLIGIMLYLNAEEESKGLFLYINSPGGRSRGIAVYDAMHYVEADVTTICVGTAASMASFVLAGAIGEDE